MFTSKFIIYVVYTFISLISKKIIISLLVGEFETRYIQKKTPFLKGAAPIEESLILPVFVTVEDIAPLCSPDNHVLQKAEHIDTGMTWHNGIVTK